MRRYVLPTQKPCWGDVAADLGISESDTDVALVTFLDSCDWRLWRAGYVAEIVEGPEVTRCALIEIDSGAVVAECPVTGLPRLVADLPGGALRQRFAALLDERGLTRLVQVRRVSRIWSKTDEHGETACKLVVEDNVMLGEPAQADLPSYLRLLPEPGHEEDAEELDRALRLVIDVEPDGEHLLTRALTGLGRAPLDTVAPLPELDASWTIGRALAETLTAHTRALEIQAQHVCDDLDPECLHQMRVALRRIRSLLGRFKKALPAAHGFADDFRWLGQVTSELRDIDVCLVEYPAYQAPLDDDVRARLGPLQTYLERRRAAAQREVVAALTSQRYATLLERWSSCLAEMGEDAGSEASRSVIEVAEKEVARCFRAVLREGRRIGAESPATELHSLRKTGKKLRYVLETFRSLADPKASATLLRDLKKLQDVLGRFQDLEAHTIALSRYGEEMLAAGDVSARTLMAMGELVARIRRRHRKARKQFDIVFGDFDSKRNRELAAGLLSRED